MVVEMWPEVDLPAQRAVLLEALHAGPVAASLATFLGVAQPGERVKELQRQGYHIAAQKAAGRHGRRSEVVYTLQPAGAALQRDFFQESGAPAWPVHGCGGRA